MMYICILPNTLLLLWGNIISARLEVRVFSLVWFLETKSSVPGNLSEYKQNKRENQTNVKQQAQVVIESF